MMQNSTWVMLFFNKTFYFLAHLAERAMWAIAITLHLSLSVVINFSKLFSSDTTLPKEPNLVWMFLRVFCIEFMWGFLICWKTWPLLLKIEHRGVIQKFFTCISKTVRLTKFWHRVKCSACFSHVWVIGLFWHLFAIWMEFTLNNFSSEATGQNLMKIDMIVP